MRIGNVGSPVLLALALAGCATESRLGLTWYMREEAPAAVAANGKAARARATERATLYFALLNRGPAEVRIRAVTLNPKPGQNEGSGWALALPDGHLVLHPGQMFVHQLATFQSGSSRTGSTWPPCTLPVLAQVQLVPDAGRRPWTLTRVELSLPVEAAMPSMLPTGWEKCP